MAYNAIRLNYSGAPDCKGRFQFPYRSHMDIARARARLGLMKMEREKRGKRSFRSRN